MGLTLVIDEIIAEDRTYKYNKTLRVTDPNKSEVTTVYFAEKKTELKDVKDGTHTYTFGGNNDTSTNPKKSEVAGGIQTKVKSVLNGQGKKVRKLVDITTQLTKDSYSSGDTVTFDVYKKEQKKEIRYKKINTKNIGHDVYLIAETKELNGKKVKVKIHEKEEELKILKDKDAILPVLVYPEKEDETTDIEASDWIEIDIKKEKGKKDGGNILLTEGNDEIEVGIKKIKLRPKKDKIEKDDEEVSKSYEGWVEKLYIKYDESDEGKTEIETREEEEFITLTKDDELEKVSYPKKISGPDLINAGEEAVYILEEYSSTNATAADKNNIQWTLYEQGTDTSTYTTITTKSKDKLYTYAKMELVDTVTTTNEDGVEVVTGGKNKLTIVFDKALKGKKIQIEPFRGSPDINKKKAYVKITAVHDYKVKEIDITKLWLQTQCDDSKDGEKEKDFLTEGHFELKANCFCDRSLTEQEVKDIIIKLRKSENSVYTGNNKEKLFWKSNCNLPLSEKTFKKFTEQLNSVFTEYNINTCKRRMHFLAQVYHETDRFRTTKEYATTASYAPYFGRGLMQLTWEVNYKRYKSYSGKDCISDNEIIANNLENAFDSAGWFWKQGKGLSVGVTWSAPSSAPSYVTSKKPNYNKKTISYTEGTSTRKYGTIDLNLIADDDYVDVISYLVNGGGNGLTERQDYLTELKKIFEYEIICKNKK